MRGRILVLAAALAIGCRSQGPAPNPTPEVTRVPFVAVRTGGPVSVRWGVPQREGQLTDSQLVALAPRIAALRAEPEALTLDATGALPLSQLLRVLAVDEAGVVLGEVRNYGFALRDGLYIDSTGAVRGNRVGTGRFIATIPERIIGDFRSRGPAEVRIAISDSTGVWSRPPVIPRGTAVISGIVRDSTGAPRADARVQVMRRIDGRMVQIAAGASDSDGRYRLEGLPAGEATLILAIRDHEASFITLQLRDGDALQRDARLLPLRRGQQP
ncbi:MAG TPA: carboxypeptidase-like regulatory domain-containing protein [Gemmatimonadaceae bacterium]|nr:carboxypeptidase-like regulatory domain-containing protein [Gemmatimonadaceae bacterium]HRQ78356.1 carboxypeptidase-like regulatory domain-containing protein [Gemmatimonadaceae bacterium]